MYDRRSSNGHFKVHRRVLIGSIQNLTNTHINKNFIRTKKECMASTKHLGILCCWSIGLRKFTVGPVEKQNGKQWKDHICVISKFFVNHQETDDHKKILSRVFIQLKSIHPLYLF